MYKLVHEDGTLHTGGLNEYQAAEIRDAIFRKDPGKGHLLIKPASWTHDVPEQKPSAQPEIVARRAAEEELLKVRPAVGRGELHNAIALRNAALLALTEADAAVARGRSFLDAQTAKVDHESEQYDRAVKANGAVLAECLRRSDKLDPSIIPSRQPVINAEAERDTAKSALLHLESNAEAARKQHIAEESRVRLAITSIKIATRDAIFERLKGVTEEYLDLVAALEASKYAEIAFPIEVQNALRSPQVGMDAIGSHNKRWIDFTNALMGNADAASQLPGDHA